MNRIKEQAFVITSKGNYGKVLSVGKSTAKVKIGYRTHEIELYNIHDVTDGTHVKVDYEKISNGKRSDTMVFLKHNQIIYDTLNPKESNDTLLETIMNIVVTKVKENVVILKVSIP